MKIHLLCLSLLLVLLAAGCNLPDARPATPTLPPGPTPVPSDTPPASTPLPLPGEITPAEPGPTWTFAPPPSPTTAVLTPDASGWAAQVVLAEGRCCVGGVVGAAVEIPLAFQAAGPGGPATEMRYHIGGGCLTEADLAQDAWQPFVTQEALQTHIQAINWIGFYVSAQFRDAQGNLSPVVCDDISMEGMPPPPTASP